MKADGKLPLFAVNPGFPKSSDSADLRDLAEEARESLHSQRAPVVTSDQNVVASDPTGRERLRGANRTATRQPKKNQQRRNKGKSKS
ncbi:hypothetical protein M5K25_022798 [Dendrobium thyrsiflorum]|uniref:Uncharacterized protein n=1 Tax=Dendrobium thyrsiflorum TaxID=117978 RepID=A0ABD0UDQ6_DENTH